jgi:ribonuclease E
MVHVASSIALYLLNNKRDRLAEIEARYAMRVHFTPDDALVPPNIRIDRLKPQVPESERPVFAAPVLPAAPALPVADDDVDEEDDDVFEDEPESVAVASAPAQPRPERGAEPRNGTVAADGGRRRRRRRRRGGRRDQAGQEVGAPTGAASTEAGEFEEAGGPDEGDEIEVAVGEAIAAAGQIEAEDAALAEPAEPVDLADADQPALDATELDENGLPKPRRRGRRGGRRRRREGEPEEAVAAPPPEPTPIYVAPAYTGPTPADPFGSQPFDIFDMMDAAAEAAPIPAAPPPVVAEAPSPEPAAADWPETETAPIEAAAPPAAEPPVAEAPVVAAAPEPPPAPPEPIVGPAIKPLVLGQDEIPVAERKRGWWKK